MGKNNTELEEKGQLCLEVRVLRLGGLIFVF